MAANDQVRRHLEHQVRTADDLLYANEGQFSLDETRNRLARENKRLQELLLAEQQARDEAEKATLRGSQSIRDLHEKMTGGLDERFSAIEQTRKALMAQNRHSVSEVEEQRHLINELSLAKKALHEENVDLKAQIESDLLVKNAEAAEKRQLQNRIVELELVYNSGGNPDVQQAIAHYKQKADSLLSRLEAAEVGKIKAEKSESFARMSMGDSERLVVDLTQQRKSLEDQVALAHQRIRELDSRLQDEGGDAYNIEVERRRAREALEAERNQYTKDLEERDFAMEATRKRYQAEFETLSTEYELQARNIPMFDSIYSKENRKLKNDYEALQSRYDDDIFNMGGWKKEKERMEAKMTDLNRAFEEARTAQGESNAQVVQLMSQLRDVRSSLEEAEADIAALQQSKRGLEKRLETIGDEYLNANQGRKLSSDRVMQALDLERQELRRALEDSEERMSLMLEKQKKAEAWANQCQVEAAREREESNELVKQNATLEKQIKDLQNKVVNIETRSYTSSPRPPTDRKRVEELVAQLDEEKRLKNEILKSAKLGERISTDLEGRLQDAERVRKRLEEDLANTEQRVLSLRKAIESLQTSESEAHLIARRAEREASNEKERALK
ncbi:hypothetical protein BT69DRAFT_1230091 [Atractiella rhizophila]|nr:hypothetical protein BT69DRAFT_1230091 [Atractiella rhizophila]